jgi:hypothetical protein
MRTIRRAGMVLSDILTVWNGTECMCVFFTISKLFSASSEFKVG